MSITFSHECQGEEFALLLKGTGEIIESVWSGEWPDGVWLNPAIICKLASWLGKELNTKLVPAAAAKSLQSCPTLCHPVDGSPPLTPFPGILQARTLGWVAIFFSKAWKRKVKVRPLSSFWLLAIPWTAAYQAPPSLGFSRLEYWSGLPFPSPNWYHGHDNGKMGVWIRKLWYTGWFDLTINWSWDQKE